jgi:hypothetical protein
MILESRESLSRSFERGAALLDSRSHQFRGMYEPLLLSARLSADAAECSLGGLPMTSDPT